MTKKRRFLRKKLFLDIFFWLKTKSLDFEGMKQDIQKATRNSIIILQTSSHNPTGDFFQSNIEFKGFFQEMILIFHNGVF